VYSRGSERLRELWRYVELEAEIQSRGNMGRLKTSFTYACIEINRKEVKFMESLLKTLVKGGDTDANSAIVMGLVGCVVGYNRIPSYFKQKLINFRMTQSCRPREDIYAPYHVLDLVPELLRVRPDRYVKEHSTAANSTIL
jgi:ADP-ribosylglycohydrolase